MERDCDICTGKADAAFRRSEVWSNDMWRLTASTYRKVRGLCYLEPKRHIRYITELDGQEAAEFGSILAVTSRALKNVTGAQLIYVYIYGGHIPHLHVHLAPHTGDDPYVQDVVRSEREVALEGFSENDTMPLVNRLREEIRRCNAER